MSSGPSLRICLAGILLCACGLFAALSGSAQAQPVPDPNAPPTASAAHSTPPTATAAPSTSASATAAPIGTGVSAPEPAPLIDARACVAMRPEEPQGIAATNQPQGEPESSLAYNCRIRLSRDRQYVEVYGSDDDFLILRFSRDDATPLTLKEAGLEQVELYQGIKSLDTPKKPSVYEINRTYFYVGLSKMSSLANHEILEVRVTLTGQPPIVRYLRRRALWSAYGVGGQEIGLWFPIGLFATNFRTTDAGLPIAAFPVGAAYGWQLHPTANFYLGASAMLNWVIQPVDDASSSTTSNTATSINLASGAAGLLLDVNNYVYLGGAYVIDFRTGEKSPGFSFVFGPSPGLLQLFQSRPTQ